MTGDGVLVVVGSVDDGDYLGPLATMLSAVAAGMFGSQRVEPFLSSANAADLAVLRDLMQRGQVRSAIDRIGTSLPRRARPSRISRPAAPAARSSSSW